MSYSMNRIETKPTMWIGDDGEMKYGPVFVAPKPIVKPIVKAYAGPFPQRLIATVADALGLDRAGILSRKRQRPYSDARALIVHILRERNQAVYSSIVIGKLLNRDHSTILHLEWNWEVYCRRNPALLKAKDRVLEALDTSI